MIEHYNLVRQLYVDSKATCFNGWRVTPLSVIDSFKELIEEKCSVVIGAMVDENKVKAAVELEYACLEFFAKTGLTPIRGVTSYNECISSEAIFFRTFIDRLSEKESLYYIQRLLNSIAYHLRPYPHSEIFTQIHQTNVLRLKGDKKIMNMIIQKQEFSFFEKSRFDGIIRQVTF